jgi:hypothetical protein
MKKPEIKKAWKGIWPLATPLLNPNPSLKVDILNVSKMNLKPMKAPVIQSEGKLLGFRKNIH